MPLSPALDAARRAAEARGHTAIVAGWDGQATAIFVVADTVKESSAEAVASLKALGLRPVLLTGDNATTARAVADEVGIDEVIAEVLPGDKADVIRRLQAAGHVVAMVGDGVNDAPALAQADLGLSIGTGTDVAIEASDLTLVSGDLRAAADAIRLSRATLRTIKQNLAWAFGYNLAAIPLAAIGLLNPVIASLAMVFSSISVVSNALRLRRFKAPRRTRRRWLVYPVFGALALAAIGCGYEALRAATDPPLSPAGWRLVDIGDGRRLSIRCTGSGSPTVVLEPGLGEPASAMARWIAPDVARTTTVCVYDRAGHGRSDAAPSGGADPARDLHALLERARVPGPYVLAGHSLGGILALDYARRYSGEVGGIVLLDSMYPRQTNAFAHADPLLAVVPILSRMGLARLFFDPKDGPPVSQATQLVRDIEEMPAALDRAAKLTTLGDRPLAVVTAATGTRAGWAAQQDDLARLSSTAVHRTIPGSTHASLVEDKADAAESSRAISDIVKAVKTERPR
jgi:pimeloyl-ACP methyl ester carboxylesterase/soluble P-type ATPase